MTVKKSSKKHSPKFNSPKSVLILGSGGLRIGQAGEFDYSGSQAIKALKEEGVKTILINPNIATVQTNPDMADKIYFLPVTAEFSRQVIEKDKPEGIILGFGGQTALNVGLELDEQGILKKNNVRVLGTSISTIRDTEDRALFAARLKEIQVDIAKSIAATSVNQARQEAKKIGFPLMIRSAYALGGKGSGRIDNEEQLKERVARVFSSVPQVLLEEYLGGWKEIEYEVVRDQYDNCVTVCNMENFDPMGVHTGESIVVAPSQTLSNEEYHRLRSIAIKTVRHLQIIGECNIQYALHPKTGEYRVIEINARLSRSSALASKATGYPLAWVAAKLALGYNMLDIKNSVTKVTQSFFEPALDYVVVKIPRWDLKKFKSAEKEIGSEMKSVGEVMSVGRTFEEALQKAARMLNIGALGVVGNDEDWYEFGVDVSQPTEFRLFYLAKELQKRTQVEELYQKTKIDPWFLFKIKNIVELEHQLKIAKKLDRELLLRAKQQGFSDQQIAVYRHKTEDEIRVLRKKNKIFPKVKQIDTLAGEFPALTNYLYTTYNGEENDIERDEKKSVIVLGSGPYRIGSSVEFDWCGVQTVLTVAKKGLETIMINCNPETVSTDYDICGRLYFEELSLEKILDIYEFELPEGVFVSMGGQIPNNLALKLANWGVKLFGTSAESIDRAEDRHKFSSLLDKLGIEQPKWRELTNLPQAINFGRREKYPLLIRPSYVLSGANMNIVYSQEALQQYLQEATKVSREHPVVISKFVQGAREIEIDGVAQRGELVIYAFTEHVENAGIHSGDATVVIPPQKSYLETIRRIKKRTRLILKELNITGPFNIQFLAKRNDIKVIELNLRASRSFPFVSKATKYNFADLATRAMLGEDIRAEYNTLDMDYVVVKAPQFSYGRVRGADPVLYVEMGSTGEVACFGDGYHEALLKALLAAELQLPKKNILVAIGRDENKVKLGRQIRKLHNLGYKIFATEHTSAYLNSLHIPNTKVYKVSQKKSPNALEYLESGKIDFIINIPSHFSRSTISDGYQLRRTAIDRNVTLISNTQLAYAFIQAMYELHYKKRGLLAKSWDEYKKNGQVF